MVVRNTNSLKKKLGDILVDVGIITQEQLAQAIEVQRAQGGKLGAILKKLNFCEEDVLLAFVGRQSGVSYVSLAEYGDIPSEVIAAVPEPVARQQTLIPIAKEGNTLTIAMSDPLNVFATDDLKLMTGCEIKVVIASEREIRQAVDKHYGVSAAPAAGAAGSEGGAAKVSPPEAPMEDGALMQIVNILVSVALKAGASDIRVEPSGDICRVRFQLNGALHELSYHRKSGEKI